MDRRKFIQHLGAYGIGLTLLGKLTSCLSSTPTNNQWKNWMWITLQKGVSDDEWKKRLEKLKRNGFHAVLPQIYGSHTAWYDNPTLPVEEPLLEKLIKIGKEMDIEIHAWMWTMPNNNPYYSQNHPNWFAVNGNGHPSWSHPAYVNYYKFMCPNNPEVHSFLQTNVNWLASIDGLNGVHLDYIRLPDVIIAEALQPVYNIVQDKEYPEYDYCYCKVCRELFKDKTGIDPFVDISDPSANLSWRQFRYDSVTNLVNNILAPTIRKQKKQATAAVFPNWESVRQQWSQWDLDAFFPMLYHNFYNAPLDWIGENLTKQIAELKYDRPIYSGLFLPALSATDLINAIEVSKYAKASGMALFSLSDLTDQHVNALNSIAFGE